MDIESRDYSRLTGPCFEQELRKCFESRDTQLLKDVLAKMDKQKAVEYMDKCIKSGLWVPEGGEGDDANSNIENENR